MNIKHFIQNETAGGLVLLGATLLALLCANSPLADWYFSFMAMPVEIGLTFRGGFYGLDQSVTHWVNDALMTLFFLMIGLEIKRELVAGELSSRERALQPLLAAIGGVVVPVLCFLALNVNQPETVRGWAIPCATDIAFALGVLSFLGSRVPPSIKILLTAIAIIDDLIAILVIALFYTHALEHVYIWIALLAMIGMAGLHYFRVMRTSLYLILGAVVWVGFLNGGLHPTLAGVVTAMAIPLRRQHEQKSSLVRLQHALHPWVVFLIVPVFAFVNAGIDLSGIALADFTRPLPLGIMLGLILGKPLGIMGGLYLGHKTGLARKSPRMEWNDYYGMAVLCGIGFTMSLFIGDLAFDDPDMDNQVKLGVLAASALMVVAGWALCRLHLNTRVKHPL